MAKIEISLLKSANGVQFASDGDAVHKVFGNNFKNNEKKKLTSADKDFMLKIAERMSKISGQPITDFTKYLDDDYDFDKDTSYYYSFCKIDYDENDKFNAIEIYSDQKTQLIVDGKDCSDFSIAKLRTLADDFVWDSLNTSWVSQSKQIGIYCPENDKTVECVLFGCPSYYDE